MHDLSIRKAMYWKIRLKECMDAGKYTQASFAEALNNNMKLLIVKKMSADGCIQETKLKKVKLALRNTTLWF